MLEDQGGKQTKTFLKNKLGKERKGEREKNKDTRQQPQVKPERGEAGAKSGKELS